LQNDRQVEENLLGNATTGVSKNKYFYFKIERKHKVLHDYVLLCNKRAKGLFFDVFVF